MTTRGSINPALVALLYVETQHVLMKVSRPLIGALSLSSLRFLHSLWNTALKTNGGWCGNTRPGTAAWMSRAVNGKVLHKEVIFPSAYQVVGDSKVHLILTTLGSASKRWHAGISHLRFNWINSVSLLNSRSLCRIRTKFKICMVEKVRLEFSFHICYMVESGHNTQAQVKLKSHIYSDHVSFVSLVTRDFT